MARLSPNNFWQKGTTTGISMFVPWVPFPGVEVPSYATLGSWFNPKEACVLIATNNREVWSYAVFPSYIKEDERTYNKRSPTSVIPNRHEVQVLVLTKDHLLKPEVTHLLKWAKSDIAKRCKHAPGHPDALVPGVAYETKALQIEDAQALTVPGMEQHPAFSKVVYRGVGEKIHSRTRADLHRLVLDAIDAGSKVWGAWRPTGLEIQLHDGKSALGLAYAPGDGARKGHTKISLNKMLLREYDDNAIWRVLVHELCHHCHNEKYHSIPVPAEWQEAWKAHREDKKTQVVLKKARPGQLENIDSHPPSFVFLLSKADPKVTIAEFNKGIWFVEQQDTALIAELQQKRAERGKRKEEALAKVSYLPTAGRLVAFTRGKVGYSRSILQWVPVTKEAFAPVQFALEDIVGLAKLIVQTGWADAKDAPHLGVIDWLSTVKISYDPTWRGLYGKQFVDLYQLLAYLEQNRYAIYLIGGQEPWEMLVHLVKGKP